MLHDLPISINAVFYSLFACRLLLMLLFDTHFSLLRITILTIRGKIKVFVWCVFTMLVITTGSLISGTHDVDDDDDEY